MAGLTELPTAREPMVDRHGKVTRSWQLFFEKVQSRVFPTTLSGVATDFLNGEGDFVSLEDYATGPAISTNEQIVLFDGVDGKTLKAATGSGFVKTTSGVFAVVSVVEAFTFTMSGAPIAIGVQVGCLLVPFAGTISSIRVFSSDAASTAGDVVIDIWKDTVANYPPTILGTITAAAKPTIVAGTKYEDGALVGWTTTVTAGDVLRFNVDSVATFTHLTVVLGITRL